MKKQQSSKKTSTVTNQTEQETSVHLNTWVTIRYTGDPDEFATKHLVVEQINETLDVPQIEINSNLGQAIIGKSTSNTPIYYIDNLKGVTGVYIEKVEER